MWHLIEATTNSITRGLNAALKFIGSPLNARYLAYAIVFPIVIPRDGMLGMRLTTLKQYIISREKYTVFF